MIMIEDLSDIEKDEVRRMLGIHKRIQESGSLRNLRKLLNPEGQQILIKLEKLHNGESLDDEVKALEDLRAEESIPETPVFALSST